MQPCQCSPLLPCMSPRKQVLFPFLKQQEMGDGGFFFLRDDGVGGFCCRRDYRKDEKGMIGRTAKQQMVLIFLCIMMVAKKGDQLILRVLGVSFNVYIHFKQQSYEKYNTVSYNILARLGLPWAGPMLAVEFQNRLQNWAGPTSSSSQALSSNVNHRAVHCIRQQLFICGGLVECVCVRVRVLDTTSTLPKRSVVCVCVCVLDTTST